ncbi:alanine:cation symporter family protein [cyanobacterium endosymbiont of Epithemia clementina EcSB]|nr:alanine:cation symporter family protein [cyanobacterium endosymbiont of Epithemia clementina EcSB]WGT67747.1 alanine:cation symporter family protein [cyanobacterium endosymbiont of Epithemia clementina EcSB]
MSLHFICIYIKLGSFTEKLILEIVNHFFDLVDQFFSRFVYIIEQILFLELGGVPLIVLWVLVGGIFCTLRTGFINIRGFKHAVDIALGRYDCLQENSKGELTSFQALATALSASVGLGNIPGVAIAIQLGGPGAVFWMTITAILGMSTKFIECTLGLKYRIFYPDGTVVGGPMYYLRDGLNTLGQAQLGKVLAIIYGVAGIGSAMGAGNMFQSNQSFAVLVTIIPRLQSYNWAYSLSLAFLVGLVIVGGVSRISIVTSKLVPVMVVVYIFSCLWVLKANFAVIPRAFL